MSILVLGAGGQLGNEWMDFLDKEDLPHSGLNSSALDVTDETALRNTISDLQPSVVINCAAYTDVDGAENRRERSLAVNAGAVEAMARICRAISARLVHYSTDYVFPGKKEDSTRYPDGYPENAETDPVNWYGETKLRGEASIRELMDDYLIVRTSWICGKHGSNFVKTMLGLGEQREELSVVDDQWGSPSFAENIVFNTYRLIANRERGTFHITSDGLTSWFGFAQEIFKLAGIDVKIQAVSSGEYPAKAQRPHFSKLGIEKLKNVPGTDILEWKEGLREFLEEELAG